MPQITINVVGADLVAGKLGRVKSAVPRVSDQQILGVVTRASRVLKKYPPKPSLSRYVRTYTLKNSVTIMKRAKGYALKVDPVRKGKHYGRHVVGGAEETSGVNGQAYMHVGRWLLFRDVVNLELTKLPNYVDDHLKLVIKKENLS